MQNFCLPPGYQIRVATKQFFDAPTELSYQPHVYEFAAYLARRAKLQTIVDIGCGNGLKLKSLDHDFRLVCVDCEPALAIARESLPNAELIPFNLEDGCPSLPVAILNDAIVICADVLEHLHMPNRLAVQLAGMTQFSPYVLVSTPDRTRARGLMDNGPPLNAAHVLEWSADEFGRFLVECGWPSGFLLGHTINTDKHWAKTTTLAVAGREALRPDASRPARVAAVIHAFNERDIIGEVIDHLLSQGVEVHVFDNWSTDGTFEYVCERGDVFAERFPDAPTTQYCWHDQLAHTAVYGATLDAEWIIHHDADEIRYSPWRGVRLADAIGRVAELGYNAIDFTVLDFRYLEDAPGSTPPYQANLNLFEFGRRPGHFQQVKCWKNMGMSVDLASSGGHDATFEDRRIFPLKFLLKHYPLRSAEQANRKVFRDRLPRFETEHAARGWHGHYEGYRKSGAVNGWRRSELLAWHEALFEDEYLVERLSGIGLRET